METIHQIIAESVSGGFFKFFGYFLVVWVLLAIPLNFLLSLINRIMRHWNIRKHGYPLHCDADGDFIT